MSKFVKVNSCYPGVLGTNLVLVLLFLLYDNFLDKPCRIHYDFFVKNSDFQSNMALPENIV